jgi:L-seryl-tRNA(Ser) seleniumtransferase
MSGISISDLGVRKVINASATLTRLGGSLMPPPVVAAMARAAGSFLDLGDLQKAVSERIATMTQNEACYLSSGAAGGIVVAVAACMTGTRPAAVAQLPNTDGLKNEVVIHRCQRNGYDHAARQTGARMVEIGMAHSTQEWELEAAIGPRTACVLYFAGMNFANGAIPLERVVAIAHERGVPVVVDAAAQIPPITNLWHFTREVGADIAIFSGGKGLRGPQSSGLVLGKKEIIEGCRVNGAPNQSIGRPMKVGKEEMVGLLAAVEWSLDQEEAYILAGYEATVKGWLDDLGSLPGVTVERGYPSEAGQPHGRAILHFAPPCPLSRDEIVTALYDLTPRIAVSPIGKDGIALNPQCLEAGEAELVAAGIKRVVGG